MRSVFDQFKENYLTMLSKLPDLGGHFHVGVAGTSSSAHTAAGQPGMSPAGEHGPGRRSSHHWHPWRTALVH
jgi:hypothetical protein